MPYSPLNISEKECLARSDFLPNTLCQEQILSEYRIEESATSRVNTFLKAYAEQHPGVYYLDIADIACPDDTCTMEHNAMLYEEGCHLSKYGSRLLGPVLIERIIDTLAQHQAQYNP